LDECAKSATENTGYDNAVKDSRGVLLFYMQFRYCGSINYRHTWNGIVIVVPISGIAQH